MGYQADVIKLDHRSHTAIRTCAPLRCVGVHSGIDYYAYHTSLSQ